MKTAGLSRACPLSLTTKGNRFSIPLHHVCLSSNKHHRSLQNHLVSCCADLPPMGGSDKVTETKHVWIWTKNKQVMTAAVERGWNTFLFSSTDRNLASEWSSIALIQTLFMEEGLLLDGDKKIVAIFQEVSSPQQLQELQPSDKGLKNVIIDLLDWQIIPAENIVAAFQGTDQTVFAVAKNPSEAQIFLEALEHGLDGVVFKVDSVEAIIELKAYFDRRNETQFRLGLIRACITKIQAAGIGDRVCVDLCSLMKPGEGLLVGSFARGLFLVHSECLESSYIASRPFRVNAGPVHAYVAIPGEKTCYLSELETGKEVIVVNQDGSQRSAIVGRVKIESRPLILIEAEDSSHHSITYSILLQNAETVGLVCPQGAANRKVIPVTALDVGDEIMLRVQGGARHTGIEIQEFIIEK